MTAMARLSPGRCADGAGRPASVECGAAGEQTDLHVLRLVQAGTAQARLEVLQLLSNPSPSLPAMLNAADPETGSTPLHVAATAGDGQLTQLLASQPGIDFNALDGAGRTPLACLVASGQSAELAKFLLAASANAAPAGGAPLDPALHAPGSPWASPMALAVADPEPDVLRSLLHTVKLINRLSAVPVPMHGGAFSPAIGSPGVLHMGSSSSSSIAGGVGRHERGVLVPGASSMILPPGMPGVSDAGPSLACGLPRLLKQPVDEQGCPALLVALLQRKLAHAGVLVGYGAPLDSVTPVTPDLPPTSPLPDVQCNIRLPDGIVLPGQPLPSVSSVPAGVDPSGSPTKRMSSASSCSGSSGSVTTILSSSSLSGSFPVSGGYGVVAAGRTPMHVLIQYIAELEAEEARGVGMEVPGIISTSRADTASSNAVRVSLERGPAGQLSRTSSVSSRGTAAKPVTRLAAAYELASTLARKPAMQQAVGIRDAAGNTCLHAACAAGLLPVVTALLRGLPNAQSILRLRNGSQQTCLDVARATGHMSVVQVLVEAQVAPLASPHPHAHHYSPRQHGPTNLWATQPSRLALSGGGSGSGTLGSAPAVLAQQGGGVPHLKPVPISLLPAHSMRHVHSRREEAVPEETAEDTSQPPTPPARSAHSTPAAHLTHQPVSVRSPEPLPPGPLLRHLQALAPAPIITMGSDDGRPHSCGDSSSRLPSPVEVSAHSITPPPQNGGSSSFGVQGSAAAPLSSTAAAPKPAGWKKAWKLSSKALKSVFAD